MATRRISIYPGLLPDPADATDPPFWQPYTILATNDVWARPILRFGSNNAAQPTTRIEAHGAFAVPQDYPASPTSANIIVVWTSTLTTGNVVWDVDYRAVGGDDTESFDQTGTQETVTATDAAPSAANERMAVTIDLTHGNFVAGDDVQFLIARDGADASDTLAGSALLMGLYFEYDT